MKIDFVSREKLSPYFGFAYPAEDRIEVREDLPTKAKDFLVKHETYHVSDQTKNLLLRELKANWCGLKSQPLGAIQVLFLSLSIPRLQLYFNRIIRRF